MSRKKKNGPPIKRSNSAALVPEEAGLPAQGGDGPVGRPPWTPGDVDLFKVPEPVRRAVAEIIEPAYRQMVAEVEDPLERSIGLTLVHLMWLEVLEQHEAKHEYLQTSLLELPEDRSGMIDRHLRMLNTKVKVGSFLMRLREMRRQSEAAAPQKVSGARDQVSGMSLRMGGETEGECGKCESCHPKTEAGSWELGVGGEKVSGTGTRSGRETDGDCGKLENCHPKTGSWKLGAGSQRRGDAAGKPTAEEMKAAAQETAAQLWQILARAEKRRRNAEKEETATQKRKLGVGSWELGG